MATTYDFDLSRSELHWLAVSLGVTGLPLPDKAWREHPVQDREADLKKGEASLLTRGLIRKSADTAWQVDRLPSALIRWLGGAGFLLRVEYIPKNGPARAAHILTAGDQGLSVEVDPDAAHFTLYETRAVLIESILNWMALPRNSKKTGAGYPLPQPGSFLPAAWADPKLSEKMLRIADFTTQVKETAAWAQSLDYVVVLSTVQPDGRGNTGAGQFALCGDVQSVWGGRMENEKVLFDPVKRAELTAAIQALLEENGGLE